MSRLAGWTGPTAKSVLAKSRNYVPDVHLMPLSGTADSTISINLEFAFARICRSVFLLQTWL